MTLIEAQQRYIEHVNDPAGHPGHLNRRRRGARVQLFAWALKCGHTRAEAAQICDDADDVATLERNAEE